MSNAKTTANRWFHKRTPLFILTLLLSAALLSGFFFNTIVKSYVESYASRLNGAQVNVDSVSVSLWRGECVFRGIQIAHHTNPMHNLLEIGEVRFNFEFVPLLSLKLIIPEMTIDTIRYRTKRTRSGGLEASDYASTPILDRVSPLALTAKHDDTHLRNLGQLSFGIAAKTTINQMLSELETQRRLRAVESNLEARIATWEQAAARLGNPAEKPRSAEERAGDARRSENLAAKVAREKESLLVEVDAIATSIPSDVTRITKRLGLPRLDREDFTQEFLSRRALNHLERLSYWVDISRRRLAWHPKNQRVTTSPYFSSWGQEVRFAHPNALPNFLLRRAVIRSTASTDPHSGNVSGVLTELSSDPVANAKPFKFDLEAEFPNLSVFGAEFHALIDHTAPEPVEQFEITIDSFTMNDWSLEQSPELKIEVASALTSLTFQSDYRGNKLSAQWNATLRNAEVNVSSRYRQLQSAIIEALTPNLGMMTISGSVSGEPSNIHLDLRSNIGRSLAQSLGQKFTLPLRAAEETIHGELTDRFQSPIEKLRRRVESAGARMQARLSENAK